MKVLKKFGICFLCLLLACSLVLTACQKGDTPIDTTQETGEGNTNKGGTEQGSAEQGGTEQGGTEQGGTEQGGTEQGQGETPSGDDAPRVDYASVAAAIAANESAVLKLLVQASTERVKETADETDEENGKVTLAEDKIEVLVDLLNGDADIEVLFTEDDEIEYSKYFLREWLAVFSWEDRTETKENDGQEGGDAPIVDMSNPYQMYLLTTMPQLKEQGNQILPVLMLLAQYYLTDLGVLPAPTEDDTEPKAVSDDPVGGASDEDMSAEEPLPSLDLMDILIDTLIPADQWFGDLYGAGVSGLIGICAAYDAAVLDEENGTLTLDLNKLVYGVAQDLIGLLNSINTEITLGEWLKSDEVINTANALLSDISAAELRETIIDVIAAAAQTATAFLPEEKEPAEEPAGDPEPEQDEQDESGETGLKIDDIITILRSILPILADRETIDRLMPAASEERSAYEWLIGLPDDTMVRTILNASGYGEKLDEFLDTSLAAMIDKLVDQEDFSLAAWKADAIAALEGFAAETTLTITEAPNVAYILNEEALPPTLQQEREEALEYGYDPAPSRIAELEEVFEDYRPYYTETELGADTTALSDFKLTFALNDEGGSDEVQMTITVVTVSHNYMGDVRTETVNANVTLQLDAEPDFADIGDSSCVVGIKIPEQAEIPQALDCIGFVSLAGEEDTIKVGAGIVLADGELADMNVYLYRWDSEKEEYALAKEVEDAAYDAAARTLTFTLNEVDFENEGQTVERDYELVVNTFEIDEDGYLYIELWDNEDNYVSSAYFALETEDVFSTVSEVLDSLRAQLTDPVAADMDW